MAKATANEIQVFEDFSDKEVITISKFSEKKYYQRDEVIFKEKSKDTSLCVVLKGKLEVIAHTSDNKQISLSEIEEGEVFGELSFLDGKARSATIIAMTDVELLEITRKSFEELRVEYPSIASKLIIDLARVVSMRLRRADDFIVGILQLTNQEKDETEEAPKKTTKKTAKLIEPKAEKATKKATTKDAAVKAKATKAKK